MRAHLLLVAALVGCACAQSEMLTQEGKEYVFESQTGIAAGTMDVKTHTSGISYKETIRIQRRGNTLNIQASKPKFTQYVGPQEAKAWPYDSTVWTDVSFDPKPFAVTFDDSGLFKSLTVPSGSSVADKNAMRAWASVMQINVGQIKGGNYGFRSKEKMIQGDCEATYTVAPDAIRKSVSHTDDCENRVYRLVDDYRGLRCDGKSTNSGMGYPSSTSNAFYKVKKLGEQRYQIEAIVSTSSFIAQFYEEEGSSQFVFTNSTSVLVDVKDSAGDINPTGETLTDLAYEWSDGDYKWDKQRDLRAREPFFASGKYYNDDEPAKLRDAVKKGIAYQKTIMDTLSKDPEAVAKAHKYGINNILPAMYSLSAHCLRMVSDELAADKSDAGVMQSNIFNELLGSAGTTAAAMVIKDLIKENKFDNDRDAARALTGVGFHVRRPNEQLVDEYAELLTMDTERFVKMSVPLVFGQLVRITCERAGPAYSPESVRCVNTLGKKWVGKFWDRYQSSSSREEKSMILTALQNMRYGGQSDILRDLIVGKIDKDDDQLRSQALWATGWDAIVGGKGVNYYMPLFSNRELSHELRIGALEMIMHSQPSAADFGNILVVLYGEKDYEVVNYAFTLLERYANSLDQCSSRTNELAKFYLKYLKQWSAREADWSFGVSKTYQRQFYKKKYGYGGSYLFYSMGSHRSTTPLAIGMAVTSQMMGGSYANYLFSVHFRIEGLAKGLIRKFKTTDPTTWKTADLENILSGEMGIRERPDQPVRVGVSIMLKGAVIFHRLYDEGSASQDGKIGSFLEKLKSLGDTYSINHQRAVQGGALLYEAPTAVGLPLVIMSGVTTLGHLTATVKRGNHRGLLYRDVKYDVHFFTQSIRLAAFINPWSKVSYGITNDRIYHTHIPRKFVVGVNPIKKELKLSVARPSYDNPWQVFMHSQTQVIVRGNNLRGTYDKLQRNCPDCQNRVIVSRGPDAARQRDFVDRENEKRGSYLHGEYFDCEMDISKGNTVKHLLGAFMPYNKNPKTAWTSIMMGLRQVRTFFLFFPKTEKCGAMLRWSQSENNPVNEIEISIRGNMEKNGERLFFRGRKWFIKALIKAKGEPADRSYRVNLAYEFTPGNLKNKLKLQLNRAPVPALGLSPYSVCFAFENQYPGFSKEFLGYDEGKQMSVSGKAMVQYGKGTSCSDNEGEIKVSFKHSTTAEARKDMKDKWYYKKCMEAKSAPQWAGRTGALPVTEPCFYTVWDATAARKYTWNINFVKLTDRAKAILSKVQTAVKAGLLPYWDIDPEDIGADNEVGPFLNIDATLKDSDKAMDIKVETRAGDEEFKDVPLRLNWTKRLRQLKFTSTLRRLFYSKIINPCIATTADVRTMDNVTYAYEASNCWTLTSANCGPKPSYAVFTKKVGGSRPMAAKVYLGGHSVDMDASGVKVNGAAVSVAEGETYEHSADGTEIFKIFRWGQTYNVYSFLRVWVSFDGNFVEVVPAPSTKGQHCGICGNYNRDMFDEFQGKDLSLLQTPAQLVEDWKWKC